MLAQNTPEPQMAQPDVSEPVRCNVCNRTFNAERIAKHQAICEKVKASNRTVFKSEMQRSYLAGGSNGVLLGHGHPYVPRPRVEYSPQIRRGLPWRQRRDPGQLDASAAELRRLQRRDITPEDYELLLRLDEAVAPKAGAVLNKSSCERMLPAADPLQAGLTEMCAICQGDFQIEEDLRRLPNCGHVFHAQCIIRWLSNSRAVCPLDGVDVKLDCQPSA